MCECDSSQRAGEQNNSYIVKSYMHISSAWLARNPHAYIVVVCAQLMINFLSFSQQSRNCENVVCVPGDRCVIVGQGRSRSGACVPEDLLDELVSLLYNASIVLSFKNAICMLHNHTVMLLASMGLPLH